MQKLCNGLSKLWVVIVVLDSCCDLVHGLMQADACVMMKPGEVAEKRTGKKRPSARKVSLLVAQDTVDERKNVL